MAQNGKILGNTKNIRHFEKALGQGQLSHAYLVCGPKGSGKKLLTEYIVKGLLCDNVKKQLAEKGGKADIQIAPCGSCPSCVKVETGNHPDLIHIIHKKENLIAVGEVREQIVGDIAVSPYYGPFKIYIMADADLMNVNAQNALLKTIEEPPSYGMLFLLTSNADGLLETVRSRCVRIDMDVISEKEIVDLLVQDYSIDEQKAKAAARFAQGNPGRALELVQDDAAAELVSQTAAWMSGLQQSDALQINGMARLIEEGDTSAYLDAIRVWCRDLLMCKVQENEVNLYFTRQHITIKDQAGRLSFEDLNGLFAVIDEAEAQINANVKTEAAVEAMLLKIRETLRKS